MAEPAEKLERVEQTGETKREMEKRGAARMLSPFEEMERLLEEHWPRQWMRPWSWEWPSWGKLASPFEGRMPRMDVIDRDEEVLVRAELPGVEKKDLDVSLTENTVTIKGSTRKEIKEEKGDYYRSEISAGSFSRTVSLPAEIDADKAKAEFKDGLLELTLPKIERVKRRTIKLD